MGHEQRDKVQAIREARKNVLSRTADALAKLLCELGPCHAVSVSFTIPMDEEKEEVETLSFSGFFDPNMGAAHFAKASHVLEKQCVELQKSIDKAEEDRRKAGAEGVPGPPGVVVEGHDEPA